MLTTGKMRLLICLVILAVARSSPLYNAPEKPDEMEIAEIEQALAHETVDQETPSHEEPAAEQSAPKAPLLEEPAHTEAISETPLDKEFLSEEPVHNEPAPEISIPESPALEESKPSVPALIPEEIIPKPDSSFLEEKLWAVFGDDGGVIDIVPYTDADLVPPPASNAVKPIMHAEGTAVFMLWAE